MLSPLVGSILEVASILRLEDIIVEDVISILDYRFGAAKRLKEAGMELRSILSVRDLLEFYDKNKSYPTEFLEKSFAFVDTNAA